jgi:hypothetical protein
VLGGIGLCRGGDRDGGRCGRRDGETTAGSAVAMTAGSLSAGAPMAAGEGRDASG